MSQSILTVGSDKRLVMASGQAIRRPVYLDDWSVLRIGLRLCFPSAGNIVGTPRFVIGACSGLLNGFADASTNNFCGISTTGTTWTRTVGTTAYHDVNPFQVCKRVGTTLTYHGSDMNGSGAGIFFSADQTIRNVFILQITKGSPNYSFKAAHPGNAASAQVDVSDAQLVQLMELADLADANTVISGYVRSQNNNALAVTEGANVFDALNIYWDKSSPMHVSDVYHRRVS